MVALITVIRRSLDLDSASRASKTAVPAPFRAAKPCAILGFASLLSSLPWPPQLSLTCLELCLTPPLPAHCMLWAEWARCPVGQGSCSSLMSVAGVHGGGGCSLEARACLPFSPALRGKGAGICRLGPSSAVTLLSRALSSYWEPGSFSKRSWVDSLCLASSGPVFSLRICALASSTCSACLILLSGSLSHTLAMAVISLSFFFSFSPSLPK